MINSGTVRVTSAQAVGSLSLSGGTLDSASTLTVLGAMTWSGGTLRGPGVTVIASGAQLDIAGENDRFLRGGHTLRNEGAARWTGWHAIWSVANESATFQNAGSFDLPQGGALKDVGGSGQRTFTNDGLLKRTEQHLSTDIEWEFDNRGEVEVNRGTLNLDGGGTHTGPFTVASAATLRFRGGRHRLDPGVRLIGDGTFAVTVAVLDLATDVSVNGTFELSYAEDTGGSLPKDRGLTGSGTLRIDKTMTWFRGPMFGPGTTVISRGATLNLVGFGGKFLGGGRLLHNEGTVNWDAGSLYSVKEESATIQNDGTFELCHWASLNNEGGSGTRRFVNAGRLYYDDDSPYETTFWWTFDNHGLVHVRSGDLELAAGGTHAGVFVTESGADLEFRGSHQLTQGASLQGSGRFSVEAGECEVMGDVSVTGTLALNSAATLNGSGTLTVRGTMDWFGGNIDGPGNTVIASDATLNIRLPMLPTDWRDHRLAGEHTLRNEGTVHWTEGTLETWYGGSATIWNQGRFNVECTESLIDAPGGGNRLFHNAGVLSRTNSTGTATLAWPVVNQGDVLVGSGTLVFSNRFTQFAGATRVVGGALTFVQTVELQGGILGGSGTITANVTNSSGTLAPAPRPAG